MLVEKYLDKLLEYSGNYIEIWESDNHIGNCRLADNIVSRANDKNLSIERFYTYENIGKVFLKIK